MRNCVAFFFFFFFCGDPQICFHFEEFHPIVLSVGGDVLFTFLQV